MGTRPQTGHVLDHFISWMVAVISPVGGTDLDGSRPVTKLNVGRRSCYARTKSLADTLFMSLRRARKTILPFNLAVLQIRQARRPCHIVTTPMMNATTPKTALTMRSGDSGPEEEVEVAEGVE